MAKPVLIELTGLQGAGKSTIAAAIIQALGAEGMRAEALRRAAGRGGAGAGVGFLVRNPGVGRAVLAHIGGMRPLAARRAGAEISRARAMMTASAAVSEVVVADEGMIHRIFLDGIGRTAAPRRRVEDLVGAVYRGWAGRVLLVHVGLDADALRERLRAPSHRHCIYNRVPPAEGERLLQEGIARYPALLALAARAAGAGVMELRGTDPVAENAARVAQRLRALATTNAGGAFATCSQGD